MIADELRNELDIPAKAVIMAEGKFSDLSAKTAKGVIRYSEIFDVVGVVDSTLAGKSASDFMEGDIKDVPIFSSVDDALENREADVLVIGVAPAGGKLPESWVEEIKTAISSGLHIVSGLHYFLGDSEEILEFARSADVKIDVGTENKGADRIKEIGTSKNKKTKKVKIFDLRKPPEFDDLRVATGKTDELDRPKVVLTLGTDCAVGKKTTTYELYREAISRDMDAKWIATGQTGIMIGAHEGAVVDRIPSDFVAGVVEEMIYSLRGSDIVFVEGQGSLTHRAYSGVTLSILHGAWPDAIVMVHDPSRNKRSHFPNFDMPDIKKEIEVARKLSADDTEVAAISTWSDGKEIEEDLGIAAANVRKGGRSKLLDAVLEKI